MFIELPCVFPSKKRECSITIEKVLRFVSPLLCYSKVLLTLVFSQECGIPPPLLREPISRFCKCYTKSSQTPAVYFSLVLFSVLLSSARFSFPHLWTRAIIFPCISHDTLFLFGESCRVLVCLSEGRRLSINLAPGSCTHTSSFRRTGLGN